MTRAEERLIMSGAVEGSRTEDEGIMHFTLKKQREKALHEKRWLQQLMDIFEQTGTGISVELRRQPAVP